MSIPPALTQEVVVSFFDPNIYPTRYRSSGPPVRSSGRFRVRVSDAPAVVPVRMETWRQLPVPLRYEDPRVAVRWFSGGIRLTSPGFRGHPGADELP